MDGQQFDRMTLQFGRALTRRRFGAVLAALGLGAGLGAAPHLAAKKKKKKKKPKPCPNGQARCGASCVDTATNAAHCGGCGRPCQSGQACAGGACQGGECSGGRALCGGECVNLDNDEAHCGRCNRPCLGDLTCVGGACGCAEGTTCGNRCVDLQNDPDHCGACNDPCDNDDPCVAGQCNPPGCGANQIDCGNGLCIPDHEHACCSQVQCGGDNSQLRCDTASHRCVCKNSGEGLCRRATVGSGGFCHTCCPGGDEVCPRDEVCFVLQGQDGPFGHCGCPTGYQRCLFGVSNRCSQDQLTDTYRCGTECKDCTVVNPGSSCCQGGCERGKDPGQYGERTRCGPSCELCPIGRMCCNGGPGTPGQCVDLDHGPVGYGVCP